MELIKPKYKQRGDASNPENYRLNTLLNCLSKLFTSIISNRSHAYSEKQHPSGLRKKSLYNGQYIQFILIYSKEEKAILRVHGPKTRVRHCMEGRPMA